MLADDTILEILALYERGWKESAIAEMLSLPWWCVRDVIEADEIAFPDEQLSVQVLH